MIHVIFTIDNIIQDSPGGGFLRQLRYSSRLLHSEIQFEWFTMESDADETFEERWGTRVHVVQGGDDLSHPQKRELLMAKAIEHASRLPTGCRVICTSTSGMTWRMMMMMIGARMKGIPSMYNSTIMPGPVPVTWMGRLKMILLHTAFFKSQAKLIFQTKRLAEFYRHYFHIHDSKIVVIGNGVDGAQFHPAAPAQKLAARQLLNLPEDVPVVLAVGGVVPRKGVHLLLEAWPAVLRRHPSAKLVIAGTLGRRATFVDHASDLDAFTEGILQQVEQLPDPSSVILSGRHVQEVVNYYQAADVFAFASQLEGLPNAVLEAMACGLPSLIVPYEGFPSEGQELGRSGTHFIKSERDPDAISAGLARLLDDASLRASVGTEARKLMLATQDLGRTIDRWATVCAETAMSA